MENIQERNQIAVPYDDYAQSANTLFHFMGKSEYLDSILNSRAIVPRYCMEDIEYLGIRVGDTQFKEVAILQKCFCDIPLHKITDNFQLNGIGGAYELLSEAERLGLMKNNTHPDYYGKFAIAFSKKWGEEHNLQPVHYLNEQSMYAIEFNELFKKVMQDEEVSDEYANDVLNRLSFFKPLRGMMRRPFKRTTSENVDVEFYKNFHDEQEWRYVPNSTILSDMKLERIIANPYILRLQTGLNDINRSLEAEKYQALWLRYNYDDIRYIIVPDLHTRIGVIKTIMNIPDERFDNSTDISTEKYILISKILVLEEIRKDW